MTLAEVSIADMEFGHWCAGSDCFDLAEWAVWVSHTDGCRAAVLHMCGAHKELCEQSWILCLAAIPGQCPDCTFLYAGELAEHFLAVRI